MRFLTLLKELFQGEEEKRDQISPYIIFSLFVHALLFVLLPFFLSPKNMPQEEVVELIPLTEEGEQYRIADISPPDQEIRPENAKLLGEYDSAVKEEQVSSAQKQEAQKKEVEKSQEQKNERAKPKNLYQVNSDLFAKKEVKKEEGRERERGGTPALDEYFPDFRVGAKTYLNVLRYPDVEYFVRLKRAFKLTWSPEPALRRDFLNQQISRGAVEVVLGVSVDHKGDLAELFILRSSGYQAYDQEALRTIRVSSPFSTPPEKFLEEGVLRMSWTFTVYL